MTRKRSNDDIVNENIRFKEVMVIGPDGSQLGVMSRNEALQKAYDEDLDLLCVAPNAQPPVCKMLDYGKYRFEAQKKAKEARRNQQTTEMKPLRLSPVIDTHDFETKLKQARKWLETGMKVKIDMRFRGRMMTRQEVGMKIMNDFTENLADVSSVERAPKLEGNIMSCVLAPKKK
ncbi:MAG: translation initiation factor IF-3 [Erysipelotrichaceae bacterium]|nr:translation initiation factor IF-3 [Erysipelotrichaceae bacterium]